MKSFTLLLTSLALAGCGTTAPEPDSAQAVKFYPIRADQFVGHIAQGTKPANILLAARTRCGSLAICDVFGWTEKAAIAQALPFTDAERATLTFKYSINRTTGYQVDRWDCKKFPESKPDQCL